MMRLSKIGLTLCLLSAFSIVPKSCYSSTVTWNGLGSNNDLNTSSNWSPNTLPTSLASSFDSTISDINLSPAASSDFSTDSFEFPSNASAFSFSFNNAQLTFTDYGITGAPSNTTILSNNTNNSSNLAYQLFFNGNATSTIGSAICTLNNIGSATGSDGGISSANLENNQIYSLAPFFIDSGGQITCNNIGVDTSSGIGGNTLAYLPAPQMQFDQTFTVGDTVSVSLSNLGTFTGSASSDRNITSYLQGAAQFNVAGAITVGDSFTFSATNTGTNFSTGSANNQVGYNSGQMLGGSSFTGGNNVVLSAANTGVNSGNNSNNSTGHVSQSQYSFAGPFQVGNSLSMTASNAGTNVNTSTAGANNIGRVGSSQYNFIGTFDAGNNTTLSAVNTGTDNSLASNNATGVIINAQFLFDDAFGSINPTASDLHMSATNTGTVIDGAGSINAGAVGSSQIAFASSFTTGNNAVLSISNTGTTSGTSTGAGSKSGSVGYTGLSATGAFQAGDSFALSIENLGTDSSIGVGGSYTGACVFGSQAVFYDSITLGDHSSLTLSNTGDFSGSNSISGNNVGYIHDFQLNTRPGNLFIGDYFTLTVSNQGADSSSGFGSNNVGVCRYHSQVQFNSSEVVLGNHASITITNSGDLTSNTTGSASYVGYIGSPQLSVFASLLAEDYFTVQVTNTGSDGGIGSTANRSGYINDTQTEYGSLTVGNYASFDISNSGTNSSSVSGASTGYIDSQQMIVFDTFSAGSNLTISISNEGIQTNGGNNNVGCVGYTQLNFGGVTQIGDDATITITNSGVNDSASGDVGFISGAQFYAFSSFSSGKNFHLAVLNSATNTGDSSNVGLTFNQVAFAENCLLEDGTVINVANNGQGTVSSAQLFFPAGFTLTGKAAFTVTNEGTLNGHGIDIRDGIGGQIDITLAGNDLSINTSNPTFTIASLNGNSTSIVQSAPALIINLDSSANALFAGSIQDFPTMPPGSLEIQGSGIQTLSGINTFTGLTQVSGGTLVLNGSIAGDLLLEEFGTLKGTGTAQSVTINEGTIAPGESIGTLYVNSFTSNGGVYEAEVNGSGESDLIAVTGTATINGGIVEASSLDGTYQFQTKYTILEAGTRVGTYSSVSNISSLVKPALSYDSQHVYLEFIPDISSVAHTHNERAVASRLDGIVNPNSLQTKLINEIVILSPAVAENAVNNLSGWQYTSDLWVAQVINSKFVKRIYDGLRDIVVKDPKQCTHKEEISTWIEGGGSFKELNGTPNAHGFYATGGQVTTGAQKTWLSNLTVGASASYEYDHLHYKKSGGSSNNNTWLGGLYALYRPSCFYALTDFTYGFSLNHMQRAMQVGDLTFQGKSKPKVQQFSFYGEVGGDWNPRNMILIQPFLGLTAGKSWCSSIAEKSAGGWQLGIDSRSDGLVTSRLGLHLTTQKSCSFFCSADLAWAKRITGANSSLEGQFLEFGDSFKIKGVTLNSNSFDYAITFSKTLNPFRVYFQVSGEVWNKANNVDALAGLQYSW